MAPTGAPAPQPLFELRLWNDRFSREFLQTPEQLSHSSVMSRKSWRVCVCVCVCVCVSAPPRMCNCACRFQCVYLCVTERVSYVREPRQVYLGMRSLQYLCQSHVWLNEQNTLHWGWNLNICRSSTSKSPQGRHVVVGRPSQTRTVSSALCVSHPLSLLHKCLLATSPLHRTPSPPLALLF